MIDLIDKNAPYRYERKFTARVVHRSEVLYWVKNHPALFREIYAPRQVNNIYLDTPSLRFYRDNKAGISERKKVRIRWYGDTFGAVAAPKLEYKIKAGLLGKKWTFHLAPFTVDAQFSKALLMDVFKNSNLPAVVLEDLQVLSPALLNRYQRTYFLNVERQFRLTFDEDLQYYRIDRFHNTFSEKHTDENRFILELKYGPEDDGQAELISGRFPFRLDKSSKYVSGIDFIHSLPQ